MAKWLLNVAPEEDELPFGEFAAAQLQVAPERDCGDSECGDSDCDEDHTQDSDGAAMELAGPDDIRDACAHLVEELPPSFREDVRKDAAALPINLALVLAEAHSTDDVGLVVRVVRADAGSGRRRNMRGRKGKAVGRRGE